MRLPHGCKITEPAALQGIAQALRPGLPVLAISMHDESIYAERVLRAGGRGYIMKHEGGKQIMQAIRHVLSGQIYVSPKDVRQNP